jgi:DNA-binding PadR family transcriptional regulator
MPEALRTVEFHILLALADGDRHGYAILQDAQRRAGRGSLELEAGTLYRALRRLKDYGFVTDAAAPREVVRAGEDDERRRYYAITARGRKAAGQEAERLAALVSAARASGLLGRRQGEGVR